MRLRHGLVGGGLSEGVCRLFSEGRIGVSDCFAITHNSTLNEQKHISGSSPLGPSRHERRHLLIYLRQ